MSQYFLADGNNRRGPFSPEQLPGQGMTAETLVWREGMADWQRADSIPELIQFLGPRGGYGQPQQQYAPPQPQYPPQQQYAPPQQQYPQQPQYGGYGQPQYAPQQGYGNPVGYQSYVPAQQESNGMAIASMILGILSLLTGWIWCSGLVLGILAVIFGSIGMKKESGRGMAIAGLVCGLIAALIGLMVLIFVGAAIAALS